MVTSEIVYLGPATHKKQDVLDIIIDFLHTYEFSKVQISEEYTNKELAEEYASKLKLYG